MNPNTMTTTETTTTLQQATVALKGSVAPSPVKAPSESTTASEACGTGTSSNVSGGTGEGGGVSGFVLKLFSMINGAEDDVVSWTPAGDAFIIGSDIQRLESETLPKFFRHNRFQSLVRQLNFYSFRKINRERNVWIYKHDLFHRDRPSDLHKVRRRTCPGVDGRKQRFSRLSAQRLNSLADGKSTNSSNSPTSNAGSLPFRQDSVIHRGVEDEPSVSDDDGSMDEFGPGTMEKDAYFSLSMSSVAAAPVGGWPKKFEFRTSDDYHQNFTTSLSPSIMTDTISDDIVTPHGVAGNSLFGNHGGVSAEGDENHRYGEGAGEVLDAKDRKTRRMEMMQQSLVVSEVAVKLEEYVKKAMMERGITSRNRRGGSGIVTPPFGTAHTMTDLITYDDEYLYEEHNSTMDVDASRNKDGRGAVRTIACSPRTVESKDDGVSSPPITTDDDIQRITQDIVRKSSVGNAEVLHACANVAEFFMCTQPDERPEDCCEKILQLLSTSPRLQTDFCLYRMALQPDVQYAKVGLVENCALYLRKSLLGGAAGRLESLRDFKVFAVNLISGLLVEDVFQPDDRSVLLRTTEAWSKSIEVGV